MTINRLIPLPPIGWTLSGRAVYPALGGAAEITVEPDDEFDPDDEGGGGVAGDKGEEWTPPSRAEWLKVQAALSKSNGSAKQRREALAEREKEMAALQARLAEKEAADERRALLDEARADLPATVVDTGKRGKKGAAPAVAPAPAPKIPDGLLTKAQVKQLTDTAKRDGEQAAAAKYRDIAVNQAARAALTTAGVQAGNMGRLVRLLDLDEIEIDEDGEITAGLDEQMEQLKADLPQLFKAAEPEKRAARRTPPPKVNAGGRPDPAPQVQSSAQKIAAQVLGVR